MVEEYDSDQKVVREERLDTDSLVRGRRHERKERDGESRGSGGPGVKREGRRQRCRKLRFAKIRRKY